jgi:two-component system, OmpR family, KDP operon response regulator KdpE
VTSVLVVDDEDSILRTLRISLSARDYGVDTAATGAAGLRQALAGKPDVVGLPDMDGAEVIRGIREHEAMPIIVLSAREREADKVAALDAGADDYVTKPFGMDELLARLRAATRRGGAPSAPTVVTTDDFAIDLTATRVTKADGTEVRLTPTEWALLDLLVRHSDQLVSSRRLLTEVWGPAYHSETHYLRVYLAQLRRKLEPDSARPRYLVTEPGMGYRFVSGGAAG